MTRLGDPADAPVTLTHDVYTPAAIEQTICVFQELCTIEAEVAGDSTQVRFHLKPDSPGRVCDDFLNYALELSAQELLGRKE
jgi:hypothetical protein